MLLIRHNRLVAPFHDYSSLSVEEMDQLATGEVSPDIQPLNDASLKKENLSLLKGADFFVCSESSRTQQTCSAIMGIIDIQKDVCVDSNLNEVFFRPSRMKRKPNEPILETVRSQLYASILSNDPYVEPIATLQTRIESIVSLYQSKNVVLFTHGFLMRLVKSYSLHGQNMRHALQGINTVPAVDHLEFVAVN